jgi:hypothetical protein
LQTSLPAPNSVQSHPGSWFRKTVLSGAALFCISSMTSIQTPQPTIVRQYAILETPTSTKEADMKIDWAYLRKG